jgi:hypothetical protein
LGIEVLTFEGPGGFDYMLYAAVDPLVLLAQPGATEDGARESASFFTSQFAPHLCGVCGVILSCFVCVLCDSEWIPAFDEMEREEPALQARTHLRMHARMRRMR